jgi:AcrR family transcriptional regulator
MVETRRRQIEDVASALFQDRGYAATSVRDIARGLDLQGASLYSHVTSKEEVLWAIVERAATAFETAADDALARAPSGDPRGRLAAVIRAHVGVLTADPREATVFEREWRHLAEPRRDAILARRKGYEARVRSLIADGVAAGEFGLVDPTIAATFLLTALNGISVWYRPDGPLSPTQIADAYVDLGLRALLEPRP